MKFKWNKDTPYYNQYCYLMALNYIKDNVEVSIKKNSHFIVIPNKDLLDKIFQDAENSKCYIEEIYINL